MIDMKAFLEKLMAGMDQYEYKDRGGAKVIKVTDVCLVLKRIVEETLK